MPGFIIGDYQRLSLFNNNNKNNMIINKVP